MNPKISVLMAVHNGQRFLLEAIESILAQTYAEFEFLIINDGSKDRSADIIASYAETDKRIRLIDNKKKLGLTKSLNKGLSVAVGEYIARMDADDISLPARFEKQVAYLDARPDIWVVGGQVEFIDEKGNREKAHLYPVDKQLLRWNALLNGPTVIHPSVMMRREKLSRVGNYPEDCKLAQDAALWRRFYMISNLPISNLNDAILLYRRHSGSLGDVARTEQVKTVIRYQTLLYEHVLGEQIASDCVTVISFPSRTSYSPMQANNSIKLLLCLFAQFQNAYSLNAGQLTQMRKDVGRKIATIAFRYPFRCFWHVLRSVFLYPPVLKDFMRIYMHWLDDKLRANGKEEQSNGWNNQ